MKLRNCTLIAGGGGAVKVLTDKSVNYDVPPTEFSPHFFYFSAKFLEKSNVNLLFFFKLRTNKRNAYHVGIFLCLYFILNILGGAALDKR